MKLITSISGRIGRLEFAKTKNDKTFVKGSLCVSKSYKKNDEWKTIENWFDFSSFDEAVVNYFKNQAAVGDFLIANAEIARSKSEKGEFYFLNITKAVSIVKKDNAKRLYSTNCTYVIGKKYSDFTLSENGWLNGSIGVMTRVKEDGEWKNTNMWLPLSANGVIAKRLVDYPKGAELHLEGELIADSYETKDGKKIKSIKLSVNRIAGSVDKATNSTNDVEESTENGFEPDDDTPDFMKAISNGIGDLPFN